jgi:uncharacterized protein DUF4434
VTMPARWPRLWIGLAAVALSSGAMSLAEAPPPRLHGTFIQLSQAHGSWDEDSWRRLFGYLAQLRAREIVVQWTVYDDTAFYPTARHAQVAQPPLETILTLADELGMTARVGLAHDSAFWSKVKSDPASVVVYLRGLQARSESVARELVPLVQRHRSFRGWYITEEIEDTTWKDPRARSALFEYLGRLARSVRALKPESSVAISGFSNAESAPATFGAFWTNLLQAAPIDVLMFQDGVGAGKQGLSFLPLYLAAARDAAQTTGRDLQVIVEVFTQVNDATHFKAVPAAFDRVSRQIDLAATYSSVRGPIAFSIPEYMTPLGGPDAQRLFDAYLKSRASPPRP